jgi:hypothetical protein
MKGHFWCDRLINEAQNDDDFEREDIFLLTYMKNKTVVICGFES